MISTFTFVILILTSVSSTAAQPRKFLTFASSLNDEWIVRHGKEYVFVWGESDGMRQDPARAKTWSSYASSTRLSTYFPYGRDPERLNPSIWLASHPEWIFYRCDGKTMATLFDKPVVPLDISNPDVVDWQINNFLNAAHDDIALDNFATVNVEHGCGVRRSSAFQTLYPDGRRGDRLFADVKVRWLERVSQALHSRRKTLTINYQLDLPLESPMLERIVNSVDAILDEEVYPARNSRRYLALARFATFVQARRKPLYTIYQLSDRTRDNVQSAMAAYLITASAKSAIDITGVQQYGGDRAYFGYDRDIGDACGTYQFSRGFFTRKYTRGVAVLRDLNANGGAYQPPNGLFDVDAAMARAHYSLKPAQGIVLYRKTASSCSKAKL